MALICSKLQAAPFRGGFPVSRRAQLPISGSHSVVNSKSGSFSQAVVDDYQQAWDELRRQRRCVLWEHAVAQSGVPQYLGSPDDLKLLLMKAKSSKTPHHGYRVSDGNRLSFQGRWYVCPGLLSRLQGREFEVYYDRRDVGVLYLFVDGVYVGEAYCPQLMGGRVSEWEARAMRKHDEIEAKATREQGREVRARMKARSGVTSQKPQHAHPSSRAKPSMGSPTGRHSSEPRARTESSHRIQEAIRSQTATCRPGC